MATTRQVGDIIFHVPCPSIWDAEWPPVSVIFVGNGWRICHPSGRPMHRKPFTSLNEAIGLITRSVQK